MHLNNKGFAISGVLYSMLILIVTLMFLILGILASRRTTLNKISSESQESVEDRFILIEKTVCNSIDFSNSTLYAYNSGQEEYEVILDKGYYLIQAWGASGSKAGSGIGGRGAYASTLYKVENNNQKIYVNPGNGGDDMVGVGFSAYNGGGTSIYGGTGGGASSVATSSGELSSLEGNKESIILVAAGGGGAGYKTNGGAGGDLVEGLDGTGSNNLTFAGQGASATSGGAGGARYSSSTKTSAGSAGEFGLGGAASAYNATYYGGGGGGGYYGGGGGSSYSNSRGNTRRYGSGGGGVSYIKSDLLSMTAEIISNGGIFSSNAAYKTYVGVGINGNGRMPDLVEIKTEGILTQTMAQGNDKVGGVRITKINCTTTTTTY
jgi:hypothetical protein